MTSEDEDRHQRDMKDYWAEEEAHSHMIIKPHRDGVVPTTTPASSSEAHHELQRTEEEERRGQDGQEAQRMVEQKELKTKEKKTELIVGASMMLVWE